MSGEALLALASMVEASTEANQALDVMILALTRPGDFEDEKEARQYADPRYVNAMNRADWHYMSDIGLRRYTASLDAAMTLVPTGHTVQLSDWDHQILREKGPWQAIVLPLGARGAMQSFTFSNRCDHAATLPLALCAAALRARAQQEPSA